MRRSTCYGVNCEALLVLTHHFAQVFANRGRGGIILLSSMVGFQGAPFAANYAATKAYVQSLAEALFIELKGSGVDVLAAAPGPVSTGFEQRANMKMDMTMTPAQVGVPILRALGRKGTVLPGFLTKFLTYSLRTAPRWGRVRIMKLVMGGMTKTSATEGIGRSSGFWYFKLFKAVSCKNVIVLRIRPMTSIRLFT